MARVVARNSTTAPWRRPHAGSILCRISAVPTFTRASTTCLVSDFALQVSALVLAGTWRPGVRIRAAVEHGDFAIHASASIRSYSRRSRNRRAVNFTGRDELLVADRNPPHAGARRVALSAACSDSFRGRPSRGSSGSSDRSRSRVQQDFVAVRPQHGPGWITTFHGARIGKADNNTTPHPWRYG